MQEIGCGNEFVYAYYFESQKNGKSKWPCKIGRSTRNAVKRIVAQQAAMQEEPIIGVLIRTDNCVRDEAIIHASLSGDKLCSFGNEWYCTTPQLVIESINNSTIPLGIGVQIKMIRAKRGITQQDLSGLSGIRQETISMIESGGNTSLKSISAIASSLGLKIILR